MQDMDVKLLFADEGDWVGLYVDGKLVDQGHTLSANQILDAVKIEHEEVGMEFAANGWRSCPPTYAEVEAAMLKPFAV